MKKYFRILTVLLGVLFIHTLVTAQESTDITFSIIKTDGKIISINSQNQKVVNFDVTGLNTTDDVDAFIMNFKKLKLVVDIKISYETKNNQRTGTVTFESDASREVLRNNLLNAGVTNVVIEGDTIATKDIPLKETVRKSEQNK